MKKDIIWPPIWLIITISLLVGLSWGTIGRSIQTRWCPSVTVPPPPPLVMANPIRTITFANGTALTISALAESTIERGSSVGTTGGGAVCGFNDLKAATVKNRGLPVYQKFSAGPGTLILDCRLLDATGKALRPQRFVIQEVLWAETGEREGFHGWEAMEGTGGVASHLPDVMVQVADGAGAWIDGRGPLCAPDDPENRCMLAFSKWPRDATEFEFRAIRPGLPPVTWTMKNPFYTATSAFPAKNTPGSEGQR